MLHHSALLSKAPASVLSAGADPRVPPAANASSPTGVGHVRRGRDVAALCPPAAPPASSVMPVRHGGWS